MKINDHSADYVPTNNDYYKVTFAINPANVDTADFLASELGDAGFESFETNDEGSEMAAYCPAPLFSADAVEDAMACVPCEGTIEAEAEFVQGQDWNAEWEKNYFQPIVVGGQVVVHSSFHKDYPEAQYDIVIDPRMAFGTGHHATTTLMMQAILGADLKGAKVVDMGTGTGILAILAAMRGAAEVLAVEIDAAAVANAADNLDLNLAGERRDCLTLVHGDASALDGVSGVDYFLANINRNIITADIARYAATMRQDALLTVSGFYIEDRPIIEAAAKECRLKLKSVADIDNWSSMTFVKG